MSKTSKPLIMGEWAVPEFDLLKNVMWTGYEKIDGTNIRVMYDGSRVTFGGREEKSFIPVHLLAYLKETFTVEKMRTTFPDIKQLDDVNVTLYGEGYGHKIQSGGKYLSDKKVGLILFDVSIGRWCLMKSAVKMIANDLEIDMVQKMATGTLPELFKLVGSGLKSTFGDFYTEGLVATPELELFDRAGRRIITKIKHKDFYNG